MRIKYGMEKITPAFLFRTALTKMLSDLGHGAQARLADHANISRSVLNDIVKGRTPGSEDVRQKLASIFGYNYEDFLKIGRDILSPNNITTNAVKEQQEKYTIISNGEPLETIDVEHCQIISKFKHRDWARQINSYLIEIEDNPTDRNTVERVVKALADQARGQKKAKDDH